MLLFKDTVNSVIEEERGAEVTALREEFAADKAVVEVRVANVEGQIEALRAQRDATYAAKFIVECDYFTSRCIDVDGGIVM